MDDLNKENITTEEENDILDYGNEEEETYVDEEQESMITAMDEAEDPTNHVDGVEVEETEKTNERKFKSIDEALSDLGSADMKNEEEEVIFTAEDIRAGLNDSPLFMTEAAENNTKEGEQKPEFEISDESVLQLLEVINRMKAKEDFNIYAALPSEVKAMIDKYLRANGMAGYSVQANTARNTICKSLMEEFINTVSMEKTVNDFNKEMETLFNSVGKEFSTIYKDYDQERDNYLQSLLSKVPEDDPKRAKLINVMDAINDAYHLTAVKNYVANSKPFKSIEIEKPQSRVFSGFEGKYANSDHNIYPLKLVVDILNKYNPTEVKDGNTLFAIAFAKTCQNYSPEDVAQHAFMYYTVYNIILLDIYKGEDYDNYAPDLLKSVNEIIAICAEKQSKKNENVASYKPKNNKK